MINLSPKEIYDRLVNTDKILTIQGQIRFYLGDVNITVKQKDVVGNIIQEWLEGWLKHNNIAYACNPNTQMPPDFFLDPKDTTHRLLEVKAFNYNASPGFDIADFSSYQKEIIDKPYMLDTDYLIFGYTMGDDGMVSIKKLWLKKVWEICRTSERWAVNVQYKNGAVHKIRPATWYSQSKAIKHKVFDCLEDFLSAIEETAYNNPATHNKAAAWGRRMEKSYKNFFRHTINIPHWTDIQHKYINGTEQN